MRNTFSVPSADISGILDNGGHIAAVGGFYKNTHSANDDYYRGLVDNFTTLRGESGLVEHGFVDGILAKALTSVESIHFQPQLPSGISLSRRKQKQIHVLLEEAGGNSEHRRLNYIKNLLTSTIQRNEGTYSYLSKIYFYLACGLPAISIGKFFPKSDAISILYSNLLFTTSTLASRYFFYRANSINQSTDYFKAHYADLGSYAEELYGLGFITKDGAGGVLLGDEVKKIGYIVLATWENFMQLNDMEDLSILNKFRVVDISLNMFKALSRYLVIERAELLKVKILEEAVKQGFQVQEGVDINYQKLIVRYNLSKNQLIAELKKIEINQEFINKVVFQFSIIIRDKVHLHNPVQNILRFYGINHIGFTDTPTIPVFLEGLYKSGYIESEASSHLTSTHKREKHIKDLAAVKQLQTELPRFDVFHKSHLMAQIGGHITARAGAKFPWLINEGLSIASGLLGGAPIFTYMYTKQEALKGANYLMTPIAWSIVYAIESWKLLISAEEKRFTDEYKEFELKIKKLVHGEHIAIQEFNEGRLTSVGGSNEFRKMQEIIAKVVDRTYAKAGITQGSLSSKEEAFMVVRLFNAFGDALLRLDNQIKFDDDGKTNTLIEKLSDKYSRNITQGWLMAAYHGCIAAASFKKGVSKVEILDDIVSLLSTENISPNFVSQIAKASKEEAKIGNAVFVSR